MGEAVVRMPRVYLTYQSPVAAVVFECAGQLCENVQHRSGYHALLKLTKAELEDLYYLLVLHKCLILFLPLEGHTPLDALFCRTPDLRQLTQAGDLVLPAARLQFVHNVVVCVLTVELKHSKQRRPKVIFVHSYNWSAVEGDSS